MASEDTITIHHDHHLSRLSMCTSISKGYVNDVVEDVYDDTETEFHRVDSEGEDADGECSDKEVASNLSSGSEKEGICYSLPPTPPRRRIRRGLLHENLKEYASENEAEMNKVGDKRKNQRRRRSTSVSLRREFWRKENECLVITRPKGGSKSLCMDIEEVKACRDLGFELEHEMLELPGRISMSCSTIDDSSGGNSPIANWRISSPGDDPRDVKARLKVWAQAVAIATTNRHGS